MPHDCIGLEGAGTPIMNIIPGRVPPAHRHGQQRPQREHDDHAYTQVQHRVYAQGELPFGTRLARETQPRKLFGLRSGCS